MGNGKKKGMDLSEFAQLDPEVVAAQCGGLKSANDGPNPGTAGESEAIMADTEHAESTDAAPADEAEPAPQFAQLKAFHLITRLREANPILDEGSAIKLLERILNQDLPEGDPPKRIGGRAQFVSADLARKVNDYLARKVDVNETATNDEPSKPFDQDAPDSTNLTQVETEPDPAPAADAPHADGEQELDSYREALRHPLEAAAQAWQSGDRKSTDAAVMALAGEIFAQGYQLYDSLGVGEELTERFLFLTTKRDENGKTQSLTRGELEANPSLIAKAWYHRVAVRSAAKVAQGKLSVQECLENCLWPSEPRLRERQQARQRQKQARSAIPTGTAVPARPAAVTDGVDDTSSQLDEAQPTGEVEAEPQPDEVQPTGEVEAEPQPDASEAEVAETGPRPIDVNEVDGRVVVSRGELPPSAGPVVSSDRPSRPNTPKMNPPKKKLVREVLGALRDDLLAVEKSAAAADSDTAEVATAGASPSGDTFERRDEHSDESILANLPDEVVDAAIQAVLDDDDPVQAWAYRTPESVRAEADRRLLEEYRQRVAV